MTPRSAQSTALSPDHSDGQAASPAVAALAAQERVSWRSVSASVAAFGAPAGIGVLHPVLGEIVAVAELMSSDAQVEDGGVIGGEDAGVLKGPAGGVPAGPWCAG